MPITFVDDDKQNAVTTDLSLKIRAVTHKGLVRQENEDRISVGSWSAVQTMEKAIHVMAGAADRTSCLVADGMGGRKAGALAARIASEYLSDHVDAIDCTEAAVEIVVDADRYIHDAMHADNRGMGTTIAGIVAHHDQAIFFNVGDSRIYRVTDEGVTLLSTDDVRSVITPQGFRTGLSQVLGGSNPTRGVVPHVGVTPLLPREKYLICSDGISNYATDDDLYDLIGLGYERDVDRLLAHALACGGQDNASAIIVEVVAPQK
jgi:serine/threonine protein phosphatase PrpC